MSRTYKDRPARIKYPDHFKNRDDLYEYVEYDAEGYSYYYNVYYNEKRKFCVKKPGVFTKKKKTIDTEWRWMSTPGWWVNLFMNAPQRVASKQWERQVVRGSLEELEDTAPPHIGRKPHLYYW